MYDSEQNHEEEKLIQLFATKVLIHEREPKRRLCAIRIIIIVPKR